MPAASRKLSSQQRRYLQLSGHPTPRLQLKKFTASAVLESPTVKTTDNTQEVMLYTMDTDADTGISPDEPTIPACGALSFSGTQTG